MLHSAALSVGRARLADRVQRLLGPQKNLPVRHGHRAQGELVYSIPCKNLELRAGSKYRRDAFFVRHVDTALRDDRRRAVRAWLEAHRTVDDGTRLQIEPVDDALIADDVHQRAVAD